MCDNTSVPRIPFIDLTKEEEVEEYPVQPKQERYPPNIPLSCMPDYMMAIPNSPQSEEEENLVEQPVLEPIPVIPQPEPAEPQTEEPQRIFEEKCLNGTKYFALTTKKKAYFVKRTPLDLQACTAMCDNRNPFNLSPQLLTRYAKKAKAAGARDIHAQLISILHGVVDKRCQFKPFTNEELAMIYEKKAQGLNIETIAKLTGLNALRIRVYFWSSRYNLPGFENF